MRNIIKAWEECQKIKIFEIPVIDNRSSEEQIIKFNIELEGSYFIATYEPITEAQKKEQSTVTTFVKSWVDPDFSLDENLQELYSECLDRVINSKYLTLKD